MPNRQSYQQYTVVRGDTLAAIAKRFKTTVQEIAVTSGIADPNRIAVGQVLSIPLASSQTVAEELPEIVVTGKRVTSAPKTDPRTAPPDTSAGTPAGLAAWFQPPRLWFTIGVLATLAYSVLGGRKR